MLDKIKSLLKNIMFFTTSYSLNIFDDPLSSLEESIYIDKCIIR